MIAREVPENREIVYLMTPDELDRMEGVDQLVAVEDRIDLERALKKMSRQQAGVIKMSLFGLTQEEISEGMKMSQSQVSKIIKRYQGNGK